MKGGETRIRVLKDLSSPKDRHQLALELGLDWKTADEHVRILRKYEFVHEEVAYGKVKMYGLTSKGTALLKVVDDMSTEVSKSNIIELRR